MSDFYSATPELQKATGIALEITNHPNSGYYEFGLFKGFNLFFAEAYSRNMDYHLYGFDSFEGMPPNESSQWAQRDFSVSLEEVRGNLIRHGAEMQRISFFKGWFKDLLPTLKREDFRPARVVVIDSDLYESCAEALAFIEPLLQRRSVILFDDWRAYSNDPGRGEQRAWTELLKRHPADTNVLFEFGQYGHAIMLDTW